MKTHSCRWKPATYDVARDLRMYRLDLDPGTDARMAVHFRLESLLAMPLEAPSGDGLRKDAEVALQAHLVSRLEAAVSKGPLEPNEYQVLTIDLDASDVAAVLRAAGRKDCDYQTAPGPGRDLYCTAHIGGESIADRITVPTSHAACRSCTVPDERVRCDALTHLGVEDGDPDPLFSPSRLVKLGICGVGKEDARKDPGKCRPGGHDCWHREIRPLARPARDTSDLELAEAFDAASTAWRAVTGVWLLRPRSVLDGAKLVAPVATHADFESRMSTLSALFKSVDADAKVPTEIRERWDKNGEKPGPLVRMREALAGVLVELDLPASQAAVETLRSINDIRNKAQHDAGALLVRLDSLDLGVGESWAGRWNAVRGRVIEALAVLRDALRAAAPD